MARAPLPQAEADALMAADKHRVDDTVHAYPDLGGRLTVALASADRSERFLLDVSRGRLDLRKQTFQNRARKTIVLARLDLGGRPHRNPDDSPVDSPHLHVYREGYHDRWAYPVPQDRFPNLGDPHRVLGDFLRFCNVVDPPFFERGLFA